MAAADVGVPSAVFGKTCCFRSREDERQALLAEEDRQISPATAKGKKCRQLVAYDALPSYLKHNEFILGYYRSEWPLKETVLSIFSMHNETLNVWTHLVGFFVFLFLTVSAALLIPRAFSTNQLSAELGGAAVSTQLNKTVFRNIYDPLQNDSNAPPSPAYLQLPETVTNYMALERFAAANATAAGSASTAAAAAADGGETNHPTVAAAAPHTPVQRITRWPLFAFLCGAMFCLLTSSACHLLCCHSEHTSYVMLRLDYAGIATLIVTSILPEIYYIFACDPFMQNFYAGAIVMCGIATVVASLVPVFETPEFRMVRSALFVCMGLLGWVPIAHKHWMYGDRPEALQSTLYEFLMNCCYGIGVVIYATRVPERWMPGKFDLVGHSHQLFHLLVIAGAYLEYLAVLVYLQWRDREGCF